MRFPVSFMRSIFKQKILTILAFPFEAVDLTHIVSLPPSGVNSFVEAEEMSQSDKRGRKWVDGMKWKSSR